MQAIVVGWGRTDETVSLAQINTVEPLLTKLIHSESHFVNRRFRKLKRILTKNS